MKQINRLIVSALILSANITYCKANELVGSTVDMTKSTCPSIGAIRWDAWFGDKDFRGQAVMKSLGPKRWHYRLPFCAEAISSEKVSIACASQPVMDREIIYAKQAGLDYWAFVLYEENAQMSLGLQNYLSSSHKSAINFSLITEFGRFWLPNNYKTGIDRLVKLMNESSYQKVMKERPIVYVGFFSEKWLGKWKNDEAIKSVFEEFRRKAIDSKLNDPYIVAMDSDPKRAQQFVKRFGLDAISSYAYAGNGGQPPHQYSMLATSTEQYWERAKATGAQVVPTVMSGWDRRPRVENPVPWEEDKNDINKFYNPPTPVELTQHLENALRWVKSELNQTEAKTVIVYAWNEFDEGGWLAPTGSEGTARIDALAALTRRECPTKH